jgi:hypothetical protein
MGWCAYSADQATRRGTPPDLALADQKPLAESEIEPHWVYVKRAIVEPAGLLTGAEIITRVCQRFGCEYVALLTQHVA